MDETRQSRRQFVERSAFLAGTALLIPGFRFHVNTSAARLSDQVLGHGDFRYRAEIKLHRVA